MTTDPQCLENPDYQDGYVTGTLYGYTQLYQTVVQALRGCNHRLVSLPQLASRWHAEVTGRGDPLPEEFADSLLVVLEQMGLSGPESPVIQPAAQRLRVPARCTACGHEEEVLLSPKAYRMIQGQAARLGCPKCCFVLQLQADLEFQDPEGAGV